MAGRTLAVGLLGVVAVLATAAALALSAPSWVWIVTLVVAAALLVRAAWLWRERGDVTDVPEFKDTDVDVQATDVDTAKGANVKGPARFDQTKIRVTAARVKDVTGLEVGTPSRSERAVLVNYTCACGAWFGQTDAAECPVCGRPMG